MRRRRTLLACLLATLVALAGCTSRTASGGTGAPDTGTSELFAVDQRRPAPEVTGELLEGGSYDLARHRGEVIVLNFWAAWCSPCRAEAPELAAVAEATRAQGVSFVGIDIRDDRDKAQAFVKRYGITYPSLFDPAGRTALTFDKVPPTATPSTLIIDRKGRIAALYTKPLTREDLQPAVGQVAAEPN
ncbi:TlpA family protein disulfide reductase [Planosporangium sp. 12N6]|uniref:TlpA family protein disulfide reductase n=1 Tax=Planosporangium spinosum TaxID=3402278 RepID=UPI003CF08E6E